MDKLNSEETLVVAGLLYTAARPGPVRDRLLQALADRDWLALVETKVDPRDYIDAEDYYSDNLISCFLRKNGDLDAGIDREKKALNAFNEAEYQCCLTNMKLNDLCNNYLSGELHERALEILSRARKIISQIVGPRPVSDLRTNALISGEIMRYCATGHHGPGATVSDSSKRSTAPHKFESVPTMTEGANPLLEDWVSTKWGESHLERCDKNPRRAILLVRGGKYFTVPKTAVQYRVCDAQPSINVWYQLGMGRELRRLFQPYVDLSTAKERHKTLALEASKYGHLSTTDLEQASDYVSRRLVTSTWPHQWVRHLEMVRTPCTVLPSGETRRLEKFSGMGNGFTFELESITFYALALAAAGCDSLDGSFPFFKDFSVMGDDIIVPTVYADNVNAALRYFGFKLNHKKTFSTGPFRESCGMDAFSGVPVRGYYLEDDLSDAASIISCMNGLRRSAKPVSDRWNLVKNAWMYLHKLLPRELRSLYGPEGLGDLVIHAPESKWQSRTRNSIRYFRVFRPSRFLQLDLELYWNSYVVLACKLSGVSSQSPQGNGVTWIVPRGDPLEYSTGWVPFS